MELYILGTEHGWVRLPATAEQLPAGVLTVCLVENGDNRFEGIAEKIERSQIPELNRMALVLLSLSESEREKLDALLECESNISVRMVAQLLPMLSQTTLLVGVTNDELLGRYHMEKTLHITLPRHLAAHFDYQGYGKTVRKSNHGIYTSVGCLLRRL